MSYGQQKNITYLEDLPDVDEIEGPQPFQAAVRGNNIRDSRYTGLQTLPENEAAKYQKYIRNNSGNNHPDSGMVPTSVAQIKNMPQQLQQLQQPQYVPQQQYQELPQYYREEYTDPPPKAPLSCIEVADHIANCPICSKIYNNDKTIYIISIVVLAIICILLLKKVLDV